jgi:hypothetical protein
VSLKDVGGNREAVYAVPLSMQDDCNVAIQKAFEKAGVVGEQAEHYCLMTEIQSTGGPHFLNRQGSERRESGKEGTERREEGFVPFLLELD